MFDSQLSLVAAALGLALLGAWAISIVFVVYDSGQRRPSAWRRVAWILLSFVPVLGFILYLLYGRSPMPEPPRRVTQIRPRDVGAPYDPPTVAAADYLRAAQGKKTVFRPEPPRPRRYLVTVTGGPHEGQNFVVDSLPAAIGRLPESAIQLAEDRSVSRRHAELYEQAGAVWLRDLDSTHGTMINNVPIASQVIHEGDEIRVGQTRLVVHY